MTFHKTVVHGKDGPFALSSQALELRVKVLSTFAQNPKVLHHALEGGKRIHLTA